jgi:hypothetical protein
MGSCQTAMKSDEELVEALRKAASIWFRNDDLLLLEELIKRYTLSKKKVDTPCPTV